MNFVLNLQSVKISDIVRHDTADVDLHIRAAGRGWKSGISKAVNPVILSVPKIDKSMLRLTWRLRPF